MNCRHSFPLCMLFLLRNDLWQRALFHHPRSTRTHSRHLLKLWDGFESDLIPIQVHQNGVAGRHTPLDEVLLSLIPDLIKLTEASDLASGDPLFTMPSFGLLVVPVRKTAFCQNGCHAQCRHHASCRNHGRIKTVLLRESCQLAMLLRDEAKGFLCLDSLEQLKANTIHLGRMFQIPLLLPLAFERDLACMESVMAGLTERKQIGFFIA